MCDQKTHSGLKQREMMKLILRVSIPCLSIASILGKNVRILVGRRTDYTPINPPEQLKFGSGWAVFNVDDICGQVYNA